MNDPRFNLVYRIWWMVIAVICLASGIFAGIMIASDGSLMPHVIMAVGGAFTLALTLFVAGGTPKFVPNRAPAFEDDDDGMDLYRVVAYNSCGVSLSREQIAEAGDTLNEDERADVIEVVRRSAIPVHDSEAGVYARPDEYDDSDVVEHWEVEAFPVSAVLRMWDGAERNAEVYNSEQVTAP